MSQQITKVLLFCLAAICAVSVRAAESDSILTIDRIFHDKEFELGKKLPSKWLEGGESYTTVDPSESVADGFDIVRHDSATGEESILIGAKQVIPKGAEKPLEIKDYSWSEDGQFVLFSTNTVKFRRLESFGDYWLLNRANSTLRQVGVTAAPLAPDANVVEMAHDLVARIGCRHRVYVAQMAIRLRDALAARPQVVVRLMVRSGACSEARTLAPSCRGAIGALARSLAL